MTQNFGETSAMEQLDAALARERALLQAQYLSNQLANQPPPVNPGVAAGPIARNTLQQRQPDSYKSRGR